MAHREGTMAERGLDTVSLPAALLRRPAADLPAPGDEAASRTCHEGTAGGAVAVPRDVTCYISTGRLPSAGTAWGPPGRCLGTGKGVAKRSPARLRSRVAMAFFPTGARLDASALH